MTLDPPNPNALASTLRYLLQCTGQQASEALIQEAVRQLSTPLPQEPFDVTFARALSCVGLHGVPVHGDLPQVARRARPDFPLVGFSPSQPEVLVLSDYRLGYVHAWASSVFQPVGYTRPSKLTLRCAAPITHWIRVEVTLPASPLGPGSSKHHIAPLRRLWQLLYGDRFDIGIIVVYAIAVGVLSLATPVAIQVLINWLAFGSLLQPVVVLAGILLLILLVAAAFSAAQRYIVEIVQRRLFARMVTDLGNRLPLVRVRAFDTTYGPELVNRFFDIVTVQKAITTLLIDGLAAILQAAVGLGLLAVYHPVLLVFDILVITSVGLVLLPFFRRGQDSAIAESKVKYQVAAWIEELARHTLVFKLGGISLGQTNLDTLNRSYLRARSRHFRIFFGQLIGMRLVQVGLSVGLLVTTGWLVLDGQLTLGQMVAAEFIVTSALAGLAKFTEKLETFYDLLAGVDKLGHLIDLPSERTTGSVLPPSSTGTHLTLTQVSFTFPGASSATLVHANAAFPPGSQTAILGVSGSGKSTLADLLLGVRDPSAGRVWRDGIPLDSLLPAQAFADTLLLRAGGLIHATVLENITLGRPNVSEQAVWNALAALGVDQCTGALAQELHTVIVPSGAPLAEADARILQLARALVHPTRLVILDGLLDGLPAANCHRALVALQQLAPQTTLVVLTDDPHVARELPNGYLLREGVLHPAPAPSDQD